MLGGIYITCTVIGAGCVKLAQTVLDNIGGKGFKLLYESNLPIKEKILDMCMDAGEAEFSSSLVSALMNAFPSNHGLVHKAGKIHAALGNEDKALKYFLKADQYMDSPLDVKLNIARIYFLKKKVLQADDYLLRVLRLDPANEEALTMRSSM